MLKLKRGPLKWTKRYSKGKVVEQKKREVPLEKTLAIIKPDAVKDGLTDEIIKRIDDAGLRIIEKKEMKMTKKEAEELYSVHREKPFYKELVSYITSGKVVIMLLEGKNAIKTMRELMGATDPAKAKKGTIRGDHGKTIMKNAIHGCDNKESFEKEAPIFFKEVL